MRERIPELGGVGSTTVVVPAPGSQHAAVLEQRRGVGGTRLRHHSSWNPRRIDQERPHDRHVELQLERPAASNEPSADRMPERVERNRWRDGDARGPRIVVDIDRAAMLNEPSAFDLPAERRLAAFKPRRHEQPLFEPGAGHAPD